MLPQGSWRRTPVVVWEAGKPTHTQPDQLAVEEPLEIRLSWGPPEQPVTQSLITTLRTPGADYELALGWLFSEGLIQSASEAVKMTYCLGKNRLEQQYNVLQVRLRPGLVPDLSALERTGFSHGGCGLCGKRQIEALSVRLKPAFASFSEQISPAILLRLSAETRQHQRLFRRSGGTHAAALFSPAGELLGLQEDIGRHNAVDKLIGAQLLANAQILSGSLLFLSGRASFELIQKALRASIPIVVAVGAPSSLAVDLAQHYGQTLVGFIREQRFNIYAGGERLAL